MMRIPVPVLATALALSLPAGAVTTDIPAAGLPTATDYSQSVLPDRAGVVSWRTLAQVQPVKRDGKMVPEFSPDILKLDRTDVRMQGFIIPLDIGDRQKRFLLSAVPSHCPFCMPAGPDALVEVVAKTPVKFGFEPIVVSGKLAVLKDDPTGVLYRLTDAESVGVATPAPLQAR